MPTPTLPLELLPGTLAICRLPADTPTPGWVDGATFMTLSRTPDELSITIDQDRVPAGIRSERDYRAVRVSGTLPPDLIGILLSIGAPLAAAGLPIFAISTFDTDYVLIRSPDLDVALTALRGAGHQVKAS